MKTNKADKKGKKQAFSGISIPAKLSPKKTNMKAKNSKNALLGIGNGKSLTHKPKEQYHKEVKDTAKMIKEGTVKNSAKSLKQDAKTHGKSEKLAVSETQKKTKGGKNLALSKKTQEKPALMKVQQNQERKPRKFSNLNAEQLKNRIKEITSRETVSKTAKRNLTTLKGRLRLLEAGIEFKKNVAQKSSEKDKSQEMAKNKQDVNVDDKTKAKKPQNKKAKVEPKEDDSNLFKDEDEDDDDDDDDDEVEDEDDSDEDQIVSEEEEDDDDVDIDEEDDDSMDLDDLDDAEEESDDDESLEEDVNKKESGKQIKKQVTQSPPKQQKGKGENKSKGSFEKAGKPVGGIQGKKRS